VRPRPLAAILTALLAVLLLGGPALAVDAPYPPAGVRVVTGVASPGEVVDGGSVNFSGSGFAPGALLRLSVDGVDVRTLMADSNGAFSTTVLLRGLGEHVIAVSGLESAGRVRVVSTTVDVVGREEPDSGALASSGADLLPPLLGGLGLVVVGAVVIFLARHRPRQRAFTA
jgi:hypothetical protein